jgi:hypothetical protein
MLDAGYLIFETSYSVLDFEIRIDNSFKYNTKSAIQNPKFGDRVSHLEEYFIELYKED